MFTGSHFKYKYTDFLDNVTERENTVIIVIIIMSTFKGILKIIFRVTFTSVIVIKLFSLSMTKYLMIFELFDNKFRITT